jgi:mannose-6-phosphate isomerase-like protein (cupin superfamily)
MPIPESTQTGTRGDGAPQLRTSGHFPSNGPSSPAGRSSLPTRTPYDAEVRAVVVLPGEGRRVGNVEFLARSSDTPRFNLALITLQPHREGPELHAHEAEDDSFYVLEGELTFTVDDDEAVAGPGTFVLVPPGVPHTFANRGDAVVRMVNVHAPAGFDLRLEES